MSICESLSVRSPFMNASSPVCETCCQLRLLDRISVPQVGRTFSCPDHGHIPTPKPPDVVGAHWRPHWRPGPTAWAPDSPGATRTPDNSPPCSSTATASLPEASRSFDRRPHGFGIIRVHRRWFLWLQYIFLTVDGTSG